MANGNGKRNYDEWSKEELIREILALKKQKTYGLVWEREKTKEVFDYFINWEGEKTKEEFSPESKDKFPVLAEVKDKEIITDKDQPVNILIEGDNYHSLAVLNFTHKGAIDVIYIDPPYNTGNNDFKYNDKFVDIEDGYRHSKWLSFMSKRVYLAKNLLKEDGLIFVSIDDNEMAQLKLLLDDVFGERNFLACVTWRQLHTVKNSARYFSKSTEYIYVYAKNISAVEKLRQPTDKSEDYKLDDNDGNGPYKLDPLSARNKNIEYEFFFKEWDLKWKAPVGSYPRYSKETLQRMLDNNELVYKKGWKEPKAKRYLNRVQEGVPPSTLWDGKDVGFNSNATGELASILSRDSFLSPKPKSLIRRCIEIAVNKKKNAVVLDFFAGSGTTGHAILELNKEDEGKRTFILCTNNENNICSDVCYPRIKKVINGYHSPDKEKVDGLGGNLKYFTTDFVESEQTDKNKRKLVDKCTEMLCIKENTYDKVKDGKKWKIFKNKDYYLGIIFDDEYIADFVKEAEKISGKIHIYVFSQDDSVPTKEFKALKNKATLCPIPETILKVYRKVFKND